MQAKTLLGPALALISTCAAAQDFAPLTNLSTLARPFALPALGAPQRGAAIQLETLVSNEFEYKGFTAAGVCAQRECLRIDGESTRLALHLRLPLGRRAELGLELPYLWQDGGFLDNTIETWHDWFGLPNANREYVPQDQYLHYYERDGVPRFAIAQPQDGPGDALLSLGVQAGDGVMLRAAVKVPTGDETRLTGGVAGGAAWLDAGLPLTEGWDGYVGLGASLAERGGLLPELQNRTVAFGGAGLRWLAGTSLSLHAQVYLHSALYRDTAMRALEGIGAPLSLGGRWRFSREVTLDLSVQEDLAVNVSPDFVLQAVLGWRGK